MTVEVEPIPQQFRAVTPYLFITDATAALSFYEKAFGGRETMRLTGPAGKVMHAEMVIGTAPFMVGEECPEMGWRSPRSIGGSAVSLLVYVEDVDAFTECAVTAGATVHAPVEDKFWGDRMVQLEDPFGHLWSFATHIEDVSNDEVQNRFQACLAQMPSG